MTAEHPALDWVSDYANITRLARWLMEHGRIETKEELQYYYEKPWKWSDEFRDMTTAENFRS